MTAEAQPAVQPLTRDQATAIVGNHLLAVLLEDVIASQVKVLSDAASSEALKQNASLIIAAAKGFGDPLHAIVKRAQRPRILRPDRSLHVVRS